MLPVYDYVLMTEPLSAAQRAAIGWANRQGLTDGGNQFHYFRLTADDRILYGGYDAIYHWRNGVGGRARPAPRDVQPARRAPADDVPAARGHPLHAPLGRRDRHLQPLLRVLRHGARGPRELRRRLHGLGVGATRFGAEVALDLVDGRDSPLVRLPLVRDRPRMFPPEPLRSAGVALTRHELARADRNQGRRSLYLRALDRLGLGFDSYAGGAPPRRRLTRQSATIGRVFETPLTILSEESLDAIHEQAMTILEEIGAEVVHEPALEHARRRSARRSTARACASIASS